MRREADICHPQYRLITLYLVIALACASPFFLATSASYTDLRPSKYSLGILSSRRGVEEVWQYAAQKYKNPKLPTITRPLTIYHDSPAPCVAHLSDLSVKYEHVYISDTPCVRSLLHFPPFEVRIPLANPPPAVTMIPLDAAKQFVPVLRDRHYAFVRRFPPRSFTPRHILPVLSPPRLLACLPIANHTRLEIS